MDTYTTHCRTAGRLWRAASCRRPPLEALQWAHGEDFSESEELPKLALGFLAAENSPMDPARCEALSENTGP